MDKDYSGYNAGNETIYKGNTIKLPLTAVLRYCDKIAKFIFIFRKIFYLSKKYAVTKFATY